MSFLKKFFIILLISMAVTGCNGGQSGGSSGSNPSNLNPESFGDNFGSISIAESSYQIIEQPFTIPFILKFDAQKSTVQAQIIPDGASALSALTSQIICTDNNPNISNYKAGAACKVVINTVNKMIGSLEITGKDTNNQLHRITVRLNVNTATDPAVCDKPDINISVGFIGNSLTDVNDLPNTLASLGLQDCPVVKFDVSKKILIGGMVLSDLTQSWSSKNNGVFPANVDYIVYQEQSFGVDVNFTQNYLQGLYGLSLGNTAATPVLFQTWPRSALGSTDAPTYMCFNKGDAAAIKDPFIPNGYRNLANYMNATYATKTTYLSPVGDAWIKYIEKLEENANPGQQVCSDLYADYAHPTPKGTYLAALVFYSTLTGKNPVNLYAPPSFLIQKDEQIMLQKIAWEVYENSVVAKIEHKHMIQ